ncbi:hypothetical protein SAMN02910275_01712 [Butyrivibrio sp. INlla18]|uniref:hypothetical protein n=1 Tax=Butyrivibrio sp. INlla18 TaxID=1520806 RepID=UPI00088F5A20|nr:hypothetical protein [Butyrivibrio sp. INlla18]SDA62669.1 hypothetical protein SAMN02910275_01712 [Butyrivibrio sp. INlla18]
MWTIKQIYDGDYGCEELQPGQQPRVSVTLVDENDEIRYVSVEDAWLVEKIGCRLGVASDSSF